MSLEKIRKWWNGNNEETKRLYQAGIFMTAYPVPRVWFNGACKFWRNNGDKIICGIIVSVFILLLKIWIE